MSSWSAAIFSLFDILSAQTWIEVPIGQTFITSNSDESAFEISVFFSSHHSTLKCLYFLSHTNFISHQFQPVSEPPCSKCLLWKLHGCGTVQEYREWSACPFHSSANNNNTKWKHCREETFPFFHKSWSGKMSLLRTQNRCVPTECKQIRDTCKHVAFHEAHKLPLHSLSTNKPLLPTGLFLFSVTKAALYFRRLWQFPLTNCGEK